MTTHYLVYDGPTFIAQVHAASREEAITSAIAKTDGHNPANARVITVETGSRRASTITTGSVTVRRG